MKRMLLWILPIIPILIWAKNGIRKENTALRVISHDLDKHIKREQNLWKK
ncbi:MAG: hypothetical protein MJZ34_07170 [Paludibacteraceae bacterium]|nr:hypothetical protein [Paludibacteraceae bacterium]